MDEVRIPAAGDPFAAVPQEEQDPHPHVCLDGYVYLGFTYTSEDGEEYEAFERVPCRRCWESEEYNAASAHTGGPRRQSS